MTCQFRRASASGVAERAGIGFDLLPAVSGRPGRLLFPQTDACGTQIKPVLPYKWYQIAAIVLQNAADRWF